MRECHICGRIYDLPEHPAGTMIPCECAEDIATLRARVAELERKIIDGFTGYSDGGLYAHIDLDADFYESIPKP